MVRWFRSFQGRSVSSSLSLLSLLTAMLAGCGGPAHMTSGSQLMHISMSPANPVLAVGQTKQLSVACTYESGASPCAAGSAMWTSSDPSIVTVNSSGLVRATAVGTASVFAAVDGLMASSSVKV